VLLAISTLHINKSYLQFNTLNQNMEICFDIYSYAVTKYICDHTLTLSSITVLIISFLFALFKIQTTASKN